jgi:hypothetical protein
LSTLQKINVALAAALALVALAAVIVPSYLKRQELIALQPLVDKARNEAEATRKIEAEYQRLFQEYQFAAAKKFSTLPAIDIVEAITKLSPDTTWMKTLEMKTAPPPKTATGSAASSATSSPAPRTRELILTGEASSAAKMIELFEQSPLFRNTTQRAQSRRTPNNSDDFQIATELKPRVAPEMVSLLDVPKPLAPVVPAVAGKDASKDAPKDGAKEMTDAKEMASKEGAPAATSATSSIPTASVSAKPSAPPSPLAQPSGAPPVPSYIAPPNSTTTNAQRGLPPGMMPPSSTNGPPMPLPPGVAAPNMPLPNGSAPNMPIPLQQSAPPPPPVQPPQSPQQTTPPTPPGGKP